MGVRVTGEMAVNLNKHYKHKSADYEVTHGTRKQRVHERERRGRGGGEGSRGDGRRRMLPAMYTTLHCTNDEGAGSAPGRRTPCRLLSSDCHLTSALTLSDHQGQITLWKFITSLASLQCCGSFSIYYINRCDANYRHVYERDLPNRSRRSR